MLHPITTLFVIIGVWRVVYRSWEIFSKHINT